MLVAGDNLNNVKQAHGKKTEAANTGTHPRNQPAAVQ
jgi:hypothetical protein